MDCIEGLLEEEALLLPGRLKSADACSSLSSASNRNLDASHLFLGDMTLHCQFRSFKWDNEGGF